MNLETFARRLKESPLQPQAYLFSGPPGAGKEHQALFFFKALNCVHQNQGSPCGQCAPCRSIENLTSPDLYFLFSFFDSDAFEKMVRFLLMKPYQKPVESLIKKEGLKLYAFLRYQPQLKKEELKKLETLFHEPFTPSVAEKLLEFSELARKIGTIIPVEALRKTLEQLSVSPYELPKKLLVIKDISHLSVEEANSLLKIFEEPHPDLMIFLITSRLQSTLPTIRSRAMKMTLKPLSEAEKKQAAENLGGLDLHPEPPSIQQVLQKSPEEWDQRDTLRILEYLQTRLHFFSPLDQERLKNLRQLRSGLVSYHLPLSYVTRSLEILLKYQEAR